MTTLFRKPHWRCAGYGIPKKPKQWLYAAFNNILNLKYREIYRHNENLPFSETRELELPFKNDEIEDKIEEIYNNELCGKLKNFLTEDEYIIVKFIYFEQLKMKEIAEIIGSTEAAVKQKHYRI